MTVGGSMSADLSFNAALLGAAAAWVKKPAAQESTGPSSDPVATSAAPTEAGVQARKGGGKQRAGLGHVVEQKKDATKVRSLCCALYGGNTCSQPAYQHVPGLCFHPWGLAYYYRG